MRGGDGVRVLREAKNWTRQDLTEDCNKHTKKRGEHSLRLHSPIVLNIPLNSSGGPNGHRTPACVFSLEPP